jgi:death-on-curing protein
VSPVWVPSDAVIAIHQALLQEHGGLIGPPRPDSLEAALARPQQLHHYTQPTPSLARLAAAYGFAIAKGHCFADGNKRLALSIIDVFLQMNGSELAASEPDAVVTIQALAAGELTEVELAAWIEANLRPLQD